MADQLLDIDVLDIGVFDIDVLSIDILAIDVLDIDVLDMDILDTTAEFSLRFVGRSATSSWKQPFIFGGGRGGRPMYKTE